MIQINCYPDFRFDKFVYEDKANVYLMMGGGFVITVNVLFL